MFISSWAFLRSLAACLTASAAAAASACFCRSISRKAFCSSICFCIAAERVAARCASRSAYAERSTSICRSKSSTSLASPSNSFCLNAWKLPAAVPAAASGTASVPSGPSFKNLAVFSISARSRACCTARELAPSSITPKNSSTCTVAKAISFFIVAQPIVSGASVRSRCNSKDLVPPSIRPSSVLTSSIACTSSLLSTPPNCVALSMFSCCACEL